MASQSQQPEGRDKTLSKLNVAIDVMDLAKGVSVIAPAQAAFGSVSAILTMIRDFMANKGDYVDLGLHCAEICKAIARGLNGKKLDNLSPSMCDAINLLMIAVAGIRRKVEKKSGRNSVSRFLYTRDDKEKITVWKAELNMILVIFNTELNLNTHVGVSDIREVTLNTYVAVSEIRVGVSNILEGISGQVRLAQPRSAASMFKELSSPLLAFESSIPGESPPPPLDACFGRGGLIESIISLAENLNSIALIGPGGIGKTSIALAVLHHDRIKERFGDNRRFIRCDQFSASRAHFLARLSKVIGAGIENPEDLTVLRPFLSSRQMILFLDNAESILDPHGTEAREIYSVVEELSHFDKVCLGITSRISTVPPRCKRLTIPTLLMEAACEIFYNNYNNNARSDVVDDLVRRLDFHALSITLLATAGSHNMWDYERLKEEWDIQRTQVLRTDYNESLAATIELSLASPTFRNLGPNTRELLGVVAFFPQGIDEHNLDWLFPAISDRRVIFDKFCVLSLTHRTNGFITMLAPIRDYLCPRDPKSCSLLCATKDCYFTRLSAIANVSPDEPGFGEMRWIRSEDVNVEHLVNAFISFDTNSADVWDACANFMEHLYWHKPRRTVLESRIEALPDAHPSKGECFFWLSRLFESVWNHLEQKQVLAHLLAFHRERGDNWEIALTLRELSAANAMLDLYEEGIQQRKEALGILKQLRDTEAQADCLIGLAELLQRDGQLDAAEEAISHAIDLLPEKGGEFNLCQSHHILGRIYRSKGKREKALHNYQVALEIASPFNWQDQLSQIHESLAQLSLDEGAFDDATAHTEQAKSYVEEDSHLLGRAMGLQALIWYRQGRLEAAAPEALLAVETYEKLGLSKDAGDCRALFRAIEEAVKNQSTSGRSDPSAPRVAPLRAIADHTFGRTLRSLKHYFSSH